MNKSNSCRYPIGQFEFGKAYSLSETRKNIKIIAKLPDALKKIVKKSTRQQLDTLYRPGGWTVRQVIHHLADSHVNAYIRMKLGITENNPLIKPYDERSWAEVPRDKTIKVKILPRVSYAQSNTVSQISNIATYWFVNQESVFNLPFALCTMTTKHSPYFVSIVITDNKSQIEYQYSAHGGAEILDGGKYFVNQVNDSLENKVQMLPQKGNKVKIKSSLLLWEEERELIEKKVAQGKLLEPINELRQYLIKRKKFTDSLRNQLLNIESRFQTLRTQESIGVIRFQDVDQVDNQIRNSFISEILKEVDFCFKHE